jgi:LCP family protein required for cell wall assembly
MRMKWMGRRTHSGGGRARRTGPDGRPRRSLAFVITAWVSGVMAAVLVAAALVGYLKYREIWDGIHHEAVTGLGQRPPKYATSAMNILAFGSDSRAGLSRREQLVLHVGRTGCGCSDTIMVVHISPGRHQVTVLNLPRDLMVPMYGCPAADGKPGEQEDTAGVVQINQTLALGGPSCLWKTVEHLTGIRIDHFIQLEFDGVVKVVNDVGGVNVCVPQTIHDPNSGLNIKAGVHHIMGLRFLEFWRARETVADGSDLKRIQRDDLLLAEVLRGVIHKGLLQSPTRLLPIVEDAAHAIYATDAGMTEMDMFHIAESFRGLTTHNVQFIEAPTQVYLPQPAQVQLVQPRDGRLFSAIAHDVKLPSKTAAPQPTSGGHPVLDTVSPQDVHVTVLNGTTVGQLATTTAASLTARGFSVVGAPGDATTSDYTRSVIEYSSATDLPAARTLATQLTNVQLRQVPGITPGTVTLILGSTFSTLAAHSPTASASSSGSPSPSSSKSPSVGSLAKSFGGITGYANCKRDKRAFEP